ncbi:decarboxylase [Candidatus Pacearchaeota archaeon]|nr:decarboxylase [Candidatus Pacearchaeota archaeon]
MEPRFILSKQIVKDQVKKLLDLGLKVSYSYKTNREVGRIIQELPELDNVNFSIHANEEIDMIDNKKRIWFFTQAESQEELERILNKGIRNFVVDNEVDLQILLKVIEKLSVCINLSLRMKFQEHRIGTGKYFVYGMPSRRINELISEIRANRLINRLGVHIHRKSQNTSEWEIMSELKDSLTKESFERLNMINLGGGLPSKYRSYTMKIMNYIYGKLKEVRDFLISKNIETIIEPGRFIAAPAVKLETEIIQIQGKNLVVNTTIYNCALDSVLTGTKMLVKGELDENEDGEYYLIKGNSPTRDDIFRYKVKLKNPEVGETITFLNAGAYNYTTDFFGYKKLQTIIE